MNQRNKMTILIILGCLIGVFVLNNNSFFTSSKQTDMPVVSNLSCTKGQGKVRAEESFCAPDFTLRSLHAENVRLYENNGKPSLLLFWASWCDACKSEMPFIQKMYEQYHKQMNFYMINETTDDDEEMVKEYVQKNGYTFPVLFDDAKITKRSIGMEDYKVTGLPTLFIVSSKGVVLYKRMGLMPTAEFKKIIDKTIAKSNGG